MEKLFGEGRAGEKIRVENGLGLAWLLSPVRDVRTETLTITLSREFYGLARFDHPSPAPLSELHTHFPTMLDDSYQPILIPSVNGEAIPELHERVAYVLHKLIAQLDADPRGPKTVLLCTHAATMICIGRTLTGRMPEDVGEEDFLCFTCSISKFERRHASEVDKVEAWDPRRPNQIPKTGWIGKGLQGGWECTVNGDCSHLAGGEERGW